MSHSNNRFNNRIWTDESVYRDSPVGNLEKIMVNGEFDSNSFGFALAPPYGTFKTGINLNAESRPLFGLCRCLSMEIHKSAAEIPFNSQHIEFVGCLQRKIFEKSALLGSNITSLQKNSTFHTINRIYVFTEVYDTTRQFIPPLKSVGFLV